MSVRYVHTNIVSRDWEALADFYVKVFECSLKLPERYLSGDWLERGTGVPNARIDGIHLVLPGYGEDYPTLEIFQYGENYPKPEPPAANRGGFSHIAFSVDDVESKLTEIVDRGGSRLGEIVTKEFPSGSLVFTYATDPEGNIVEIQNWRDPK